MVLYKELKIINASLTKNTNINKIILEIISPLMYSPEIINALATSRLIRTKNDLLHFNKTDLSKIKIKDKI